MNNNGGAISFDALINNSQFLKSFQEMEERIKGFTNKATAEAEKTDTVFSKLGKAIENTFTSDNLREVAQEIIKVRGEFQALEGSLKVMLGSKEKADELMARVADLAAKTPLSLTQVGESAKLMVAYGFSTDTVIGHLQMLGDVAHGVNMPIEDLVNTFGAIRTNGVASLSDIEGMAGKGIPIFEVLGNVLNTNRDGVEKMVEASKVGLPQIELAFQSMTSTGGMFSGVMKEQAKSVDALMTNLEESINRVYNEIGKDTDGLVAGTLQMGVSMLENYQSIAKIIEVLAIAYGAYKAALLVVNATEAAAIAIKGGWTIATLAEYQALLLVEGAQKVLNATMLANPYVAVTTLIIGLASAVYLLSTDTAIAERAQNRYNTELAEFNKKINNLKDETNKLNNIIRNNSSAQGEQIKAYEKLQKLYPDMLKNITLHQFKTMDAAKAQREFNEAIESMSTANLKTQLEEVNKHIKKTQASLLLLRTTPQLGVSGGTSSQYFLLSNKLNDQKALQKKYAEEINNNRRRERKAIQEEENNNNGAVIKNKKYYQDKISALELEQQKYDVGTKKYIEYQNKIDALNKVLNPKKGSDSTDKAPQVDEKLKGTIAYYDQIIARSKYLQERTTNQSSLTTLIVEQGEAMRKKAELQEANDKQLKELSVKSTREQIEEAESQYKIYENFKTVLGKDSADKQKQFAELIKNGHSFTEYLLKQQEKYKAELSKNPEDEKASENLVVTTVKYNEVTGKKTRLQQLTEDIAKVKVEAKDLSEVLEKLESYQSGLKGDTSESGRDQSEFLQAEIEDVKKKQLKELDDFLKSKQSYQKAKENIEKEFANKRKTLLERHKGNNTSQIYQDELKIINDSETEALAIIEEKRNENAKGFKNLQDRLTGASMKTLKEELKNEQEKLNAADLSVEKRKEIASKVEEIQENINKLNKKNIEEFLAFGGKLGGVLSGMGGSAGELGKALSSAFSYAENFKDVFTLKKGATGTELFTAISGGALGVLSIIGSIMAIEAEDERRAKERRLDALKFESDYRIAINKRIGEQNIANESIYGKNYLGRLSDSFKMFYDANDNLKASISSLGQGFAFFDFSKIEEIIKKSNGTISALEIGKSLFSGTLPLLKLYPELIQTAANGYQTINKELAESLIKNNQLDDATKQLVQNALDWQNQLDDASKKIKEVFSDLTGSLGDKLRDGLVNAFKDGTSAAEAFGQAVGGILEDMMSKLIFNAVFSKALDQLEKNLGASFDYSNPNADYNAMDDFGIFMTQYDSLWPQFQKMLQEAKDSAAAHGIKIYQPSDASGNNNSLTGSIKSVTEDTANVLAGNITQLRVVATNQLVTMRNVQSIAQSQLDLQSKFLPYLERMNSSLEKLNSGDNVLRVKF